MLIPRVLTALVAVPIILAAVWAGPPWITLLAVAAAVMGAREAYRLCPLTLNQEAGAATTTLPVLLGGVWATALALAGELAATPYDFAKSAAAICVAGCGLALLWMIAAWRGRRPLAAAAWLVITPAYIGGGLACAIALRGINPGPATDAVATGADAVATGFMGAAEVGFWWLLLVILGVMAADTAAFFTGRLIGRRQMAPSVSPSKTWEGAAGGLVGATAAALVLGLATPLQLEVWQAAATGVILGVVSPAGDLMESKVKRWAGAKDSGAIFPGHGGMLDRLDSLLPCFIVVYVMAVVFGAAN